VAAERGRDDARPLSRRRAEGLADSAGEFRVGRDSGRFNDAAPELGLERNGHFKEPAGRTGLEDQLGGINLVQADYNNDGRLDLFVMRGGWEGPIRNSMLRNKGDGTFTDVTRRDLLAGQPAIHHILVVTEPAAPPTTR
jgi:hypothetical protein